jgi:GT2 family glycosyltransferase
MIVRNVEVFLAEAIESILSQSFTDFEFLILDFGSNDRSKAIASNYASRDSRVRLHETQPCGIAEARNAVCYLARGQYIAIQDADDVSFRDRLLLQVDFMEKYRDVSLLGGAAEWVDSRTSPLWVIRFPTEDCEIRSALSTRCPFSQTAVLMRREAFVAVGGYRSAFAPAEDYDLWLRLSEQGRLANLKEIVVKYRIHSDQVSIGKRKEQTLGFLAAQVSAAYRKKGIPDPLNSVKAITPELLTSLNVSQADMQAALFSNYSNWIQNLHAAREYRAALEIAEEVLKSNWEHLDRSELADLQLLVARIHWKQGQYLESFAAACRAKASAVTKHFGKTLLRRVGFCRT